MRVIFCGVILVSSILIAGFGISYWMFSRYAMDANVKYVHCYNLKRINDYGAHRSCNTELLNGTKFVSYDKNKSICQNRCDHVECIKTQKIQVNGSIVKFSQCYKDVSYEYFDDNCLNCDREDIINALVSGILVTLCWNGITLVCVFAVCVTTDRCRKPQDICRYPSTPSENVSLIRTKIDIDDLSEKLSLLYG